MNYSQPNGDGSAEMGDYTANCYLNLGEAPATEDSITFDDGKCMYHSRSYYCQSLITSSTTTTTGPTTTTTEPVVVAAAPSSDGMSGGDKGVKVITGDKS